LSAGRQVLDSAAGRDNRSATFAVWTLWRASAMILGAINTVGRDPLVLPHRSTAESELVPLTSTLSGPADHC